MRSTQSFFRTIFRTVFRTGLFAGLAGMTAAACQAQTSVALGLYGAFNGATSGDGTKQSPANQAGGLVELRQIRNPLVGYEFTYAYNRANQGFSYFSDLTSPPCPMSGCPVTTASISNNAHEVTGDWVVSFRAANLRPFALAGGGLLLNMPSGGTVTTTTCGTVNPLCSQTTTAAATSTISGRRVCLRGRAGLGIIAASRPPFAVPRESLQGARDCQRVFIDECVYPYGRAGDRDLFPAVSG